MENRDNAKTKKIMDRVLRYVWYIFLVIILSPIPVLFMVLAAGHTLPNFLIATAFLWEASVLYLLYIYYS